MEILCQRVHVAENLIGGLEYPFNIATSTFSWYNSLFYLLRLRRSTPVLTGTSIHYSQYRQFLWSLSVQFFHRGSQAYKFCRVSVSLEINLVYWLIKLSDLWKLTVFFNLSSIWVSCAWLFTFFVFVFVFVFKRVNVCARVYVKCLSSYLCLCLCLGSCFCLYSCLFVFVFVCVPFRVSAVSSRLIFLSL